MLTAERRQVILGRLERDGKVVAAELVSDLGVSEDTVRRDLRDLAARGVLQRVHGGALPPGAGAAPFARRLEVAQDAKAALAEAALPLLAGAEVVLLDGGTTCLELARRLPAAWGGTVVTNSPPVAVALAAHPRAQVVLLGGRLLKEEQVAVGADTVAAVRDLSADVGVLGICSLHPERGVTAHDREEAFVKRALVAASRRVVALAAAEKLAAASPYRVAATAELDALVTDGDEAASAPFAAAGLEVVRA
jgi:DeoR/GlpR family transcriptional regulator of sugar metabolism